MPDAPRPDAATYAEWLQQQLAAAEDQAMPRLAALAQRLRSAAPPREDCGVLAAACAAFEERLAGVDFGLLAPAGLVARLTGRVAVQARAFAGQYEAVLAAWEALRAGMAGFGQGATAPEGTERRLQTLENGARALAQAVDEATGWLGEATRLLPAPDDWGPRERRVAEVASGASPRLKRLHAAATAALDVVESIRRAAAARQSLALTLEAELVRCMEDWTQRMRALVAGPDTPPAPALVAALQQPHRELRRNAHKAGAACMHVRERDAAVQRAMQALRGPG